MTRFRVLVCGGRLFNSPALLNRTMYEVHKDKEITLLIEGGANGADKLAGMWAHEWAVPYLVVPAKWGKYGKRAGYLRNVEMLGLRPDLVVAFPGGAGTKQMVRIAKDAGVDIYEVSL